MLCPRRPPFRSGKCVTHFECRYETNSMIFGTSLVSRVSVSKETSNTAAVLHSPCRRPRPPRAPTSAPAAPGAAASRSARGQRLGRARSAVGRAPRTCWARSRACSRRGGAQPAGPRRPGHLRGQKRRPGSSAARTGVAGPSEGVPRAGTRRVWRRRRSR